VVCLGYTTLLLKGKESFFYPEGTEGSEVAALSGHSESLQDVLWPSTSFHIKFNFHVSIKEASFNLA